MAAMQTMTKGASLTGRASCFLKGCDNVNFRHYLFLWFGASVSIAEILAGGILGPMGWSAGLVAIVAGHTVGVALLMLCAQIGAREKLGAIESTKITFGLYGSRLFSFLNIMQLIGWTAVMIMSAAHSANAVSKMLWQADVSILWHLFMGGLIMVWIVLGREGGWKRVNMAACALLFGLTVMLSALVFRDAAPLAAPTAGGMPFSAALELSVAMPLSWLPLAADYTRFASSERGAVWGSGIGYFVGSCWMYAIGLAAVLAAGNADPSPIMLAANLGLAALGIIILATVTTTFMDAYSAGVSVTNLLPAVSEKSAALAVTVLGTVLALAVNMEQYEWFLLMIGSVFAPLFAIVLTDYFVRRNRAVRPELLANWAALAVWAIGVILYYQLLTLDLIVGATIPVILITGVLYAVVGRFAEAWNYCRKRPTYWAG